VTDGPGRDVGDDDVGDEPDETGDVDDAGDDGVVVEQVVVEQVPAALAGERLDRVVSLITGRSRRDASALVSDGAVRIDGRAVRGRAHRLAEGEEIAIDVGEPAAPVELAPDPVVVVDEVYVDDDVIVIDKPPGLVVHPGAGHLTSTAVQGLLARHPDLAGVGPDPSRPGIVHRIDRDTSGLLVVARSEVAYRSLTAQLAARTVERRYLGLVWGHVAEPAGEIDGPIARSARDPLRMTVSAAGKPARTGYTVDRTFSDPVEVTLVTCRLFTGRTHQIRVHMRSIGHPIVGDHRYDGYRQSLVTPRLFLHAATLGFEHPVTGAWLRFESPLPADLATVLDRLR
jgi:23S rRNA pseudouridine1911/1915/1917 synthase